MNRVVPIIALAGAMLFAWVAMGAPLPALAWEDAAETNAPATVTPSVSRLKDALRGRPEAKRIKFLYAALADVLERDATQIATTKQVAESNVKIGQLAYGSVSMPAEVREALVAIFTEALGQEVALSPERRAKAVAACRSIAWAAGG